MDGLCCLICNSTVKPVKPSESDKQQLEKLRTLLAKVLVIDIRYFEGQLTICDGCVPQIKFLLQTAQDFFKLKQTLENLSRELCRSVISTRRKKLQSDAQEGQNRQNVEDFDIDEWNSQRNTGLIRGEDILIDHDVIEHLNARLEKSECDVHTVRLVRSQEHFVTKKQSVRKLTEDFDPRNDSSLCGDSRDNEDSVDNTGIKSGQKLVTKDKSRQRKTPYSSSGSVTSDNKCGECQRVFKSVFSLRAHLRVHVREGKSADGNFACSHCTKTFPDTASLSTHKKEHENERNYCPLCCKILSKGTLQTHLRSHYVKDFTTASKAVVCQICKKPFESTLALASHMNVHKGDYSCVAVADSCKKSFTSFVALKQHENFHKIIPPKFDCDYCFDIFEDEEKQKSHVAAHEEEMYRKKFMCQKCGLGGFMTTINLQRHIRLSHSSVELSCEICQKVFVTAQRLKVHKARHNISDAPFSCKECQLNFPQKVLLDSHNTKHHSAKMPYQCSHCEHKGFSNPRSLRFHLNKTHPEKYLEVKSKVCEVCYKNFKMDGELQDHILQCHEHLKCKVCGRQFKMLVHLQEHTLGHAAIKPFQCQFCSKGFVRQKQLEGHVKTVHSDSSSSTPKPSTAAVVTENITYVIRIP